VEGYTPCRGRTGPGEGTALNDFHYAVVVGINTYPAFPGRNLQFARDDADNFEAWLISPNGGALPPKNVQKITASPAREAAFTGAADAYPTRTDVDQALLEVTNSARNDVSADKRAWESTRLYVYVSGHGIAPQGGEAALLLPNANEDMLGQNIELSLYSHWYEACGYFREVVVFADCCREQLGGTPTAIAPPFNVCFKPYGKTVPLLGYATALGGTAYEPRRVPNPNEGRGYFTRALLAGLNGDAPDSLASGAVTSRSLGPYLRDLVTKMTEKETVPQDVQVKTETTRVIVFRPAPQGAAPPARPKRKTVIAFPGGYSGVVELQTGTFAPVGTWDAAKGDWTVDLEEGLYIMKSQVAGAAAFANKGLFQVIGHNNRVQL